MRDSMEHLMACLEGEVSQTARLRARADRARASATLAEERYQANLHRITALRAERIRRMAEETRNCVS